MQPLRETQAARLRRALLEHGGNCTVTARALGIPRTTLVSQARRLGLI